MNDRQHASPLRCAIYTRKSHEEGLDQDFNSIDSQREAGLAYVAAQRHEGWTAIEDSYDDPAFSGGNMERPGLKRLMRDVELGKVDVIVVYKIDRLTRSLHDFSQLVKVFEEMNVSFVAVTQEFNTTNSMGRLMLNVLLSFAQFEREVTAERIRDKVAASKKKGIWMGGIPSLGYDVKDRMLVVNEAEAQTVKHMFTRFIEIGSATKLVNELKLDGVTTKSWTTQAGIFRPGKPIDKGFMYKFFKNRVYLGEIHHKKQWYQGKHEAIIDQQTWDAVHAILAKNSRQRGNNARAKINFLLKGLLFDKHGHALTTSFANSRHGDGKRYRYYLSILDAKQGAGASDLPRFPAAELESAITDQVLGLLKTQEIAKQVADYAIERDSALDEAKVTVALTQMTEIWDELFPDEQARIIQLMVEKVTVTREGMEVILHKNGIEYLALEVDPSLLEEKRTHA